MWPQVYWPDAYWETNYWVKTSGAITIVITGLKFTCPWQSRVWTAPNLGRKWVSEK